MRSTQWQLGTVGNHPTICPRTQGNQEKPETRWPVTGPSGYRLLASLPASNKKKQSGFQVNNKYIIRDTLKQQFGMRSQPTDLHLIYPVHSPQKPQYTMYASTCSAWHHITKNITVVCPYTYFTHTSTTSQLFPELVLLAPSIPYLPTQHYVMLRLFT